MGIMLQVPLHRKHISILMADITGFHDYVTRVGVTNNAMSIVLDFHAQYVSLLEEVSKANKAMVISITGDRVILAWNAATPCGNHAQQVF